MTRGGRGLGNGPPCPHPHPVKRFPLAKATPPTRLASAPPHSCTMASYGQQCSLHTCGGLTCAAGTFLRGIWPMRRV